MTTNHSHDTIRIAGIVNDSIVDGPGLRMTIFLQGCRHACEGCHNPQSWPMDGGTETTADALLAKVRANPLLQGVTLSGGEPLLQAAALLPFAETFRKDCHSRACPENPASWDLAIYTGYTFEEILALPEDGGRQDAAPALACRSAVFALLGLASTLIDGRFVLAEKTLTLPFRGSRNQRILDLPASLAAAAPILQSDPRWHASAQK